MGLLDLLGGGDQNAINQTYGVPQGVVDNANSNSLLSLSGLLMAAGQRMTPMQRAQYLSQIGNVANERDNSLYKGAQSYLMGRKANAELAELAKPGKAGVHVVGGALVDDSGKVLYQQPQRQTAEYQTNTDDLGNIWQTNTATGQKQLLKGGEKPGNEKMTQDQANAALFSDRMNKSNAVISDPNIYKYGMGVAGTMNRANAAIPIIGNAFVDKQYQQYDQAKRDFLNATLRRESGAAIGKDEFANADLQYFPQVGDSEEVIKQKEANRRTAIEGIHNAASPQFKRENPLTQPTTPQLKPMSRDVFQKASEAIKKGASPAAVRQHLIDSGFDATGLQ